MKRIFHILAGLTLFLCCACSHGQGHIGLTVIPYGTVTDKIDLDIRAGFVNPEDKPVSYDLNIRLVGQNVDTLLHSGSMVVDAGGNHLVRLNLPAAGLAGDYDIEMDAKGSNGAKCHSRQSIKVVPSEIRSDRTIDGAWCGIYHWSEQEGLMWNKDIRMMTDGQWKELVSAMHTIGMDAVVIQEVFRNEYYVGRHDLTVENYEGKAFYPSKLYPGRMPIAAEDPVEAILSQADRLGMHVLVGVGMFAWFDFTQESLLWHKKVARELWDMYGHHESFYGFYISEECDGSLTTYDPESSEKTLARKKEIVDFFKEMKAFCATLAPEKPLMLATNSMNITQSEDTYRQLLGHLDILCPFGFARMPESDITGKEAADILQSYCDDAGAHLWFDLEAFLFNPDMSLYPKPMEQIITELCLFDNFEKVLCYQFPGVFNSPEMSRQIGEDRTLQLYSDYRNYYDAIRR